MCGIWANKDPLGFLAIQVKWSRDDRKTPREMLRRENEQPPGRDRGGPPRRRRSFSPGNRSPPPPRRECERSPGGYRSPPPRSPAPRSPPPRKDDRRHDRSPPRRSSPVRREYSGSPPLCRVVLVHESSPVVLVHQQQAQTPYCLLYTSPSPRD